MSELMNLDDFKSMVQELRKTAGEIKGVKSVGETVSVSYILEIESEEDRANVETVGGLLSAQASKYGLQLEFVAVTPDEIKQANAQMAEYINSQAKFKA